MVELLGSLFSRFDAIAAQLGLEKIKTIGDGYMVAGGLPEPRPDHALAVAEMALAMHDAANGTAVIYDQPIRLRIGIHTGALVAGVIGTHKFVYDVWGDTVNTAKRMETYGLPGRIHVSAATQQILRDAFRFGAPRKRSRARAEWRLFFSTAPDPRVVDRHSRFSYPVWP
jgi:adenylate cyclase